MATATITAKWINPPGVGKKNATIKCPDDSFYLIPPEMTEGLEQGANYKIDYRVNNFKGVQYKTIEKIEPVKSPTLVHGGGTGKYGVDNKIVAERIYVCGLLNAMMGNPNILPANVTLEMLVEETKKYRAAWDQTFGKLDEEMNDEVPF